MGSYIPRKDVFVLEPWRFREFVVPSLDNTNLKPYMSPVVDPDFKSAPVYFTDLFTEELVSDELKQNPRLLEACRQSATQVKEYLEMSKMERLDY